MTCAARRVKGSSERLRTVSAEPFPLALVGAGRMGRAHARALAGGPLEPVALVEPFRRGGGAPPWAGAAYWRRFVPALV